MKGKLERRFVSSAEVRAGADGSQIEGHAAVFNEDYVLYEGSSYRIIETIKPGAFKRALKEKQDVRCLQNHDANCLLGRTKAKTLTLREDENGLFFQCSLPDTSIGRDVRTLIGRGDLSGCSFAFTVVAQSWREEKKDGVTVSTREIEDVDLFDVGPVTYPAYEGTDVSARSRWPQGVPAEVRSHLPEVARDGDEEDSEDMGECSCRCAACKRCKERSGNVGDTTNNCQCACAECQAGDCANCSDPDCSDPECKENAAGDGDSDADDRSRMLADVDARLRLAGLCVQ